MWNEVHVLPGEGLLKRSPHPFRWRSFKMKPTSFRIKVFWNEAYILSDKGLLKRSLRPFGWWLSPMFLGFWHPWSFLCFHLKRSPRPSGQMSFETKTMSFQTKAKPYVFGLWHAWSFLCFYLKRSLGPLKWSPRPSARRSFETKSTSFHTEVFWNKAHVLPDECLLKWSPRPSERRYFLDLFTFKGASIFIGCLLSPLHF
jgi:hypothetical protein